MKSSRRLGWVAGAFLFAFVPPGYAQPAPPSPPAFSVIAPISGTLVATTTTGRLQLPNVTTRYPSVLITNEGAAEAFISIGAVTVNAVVCASTTGNCNSTPLPAGTSISVFAGGGYVAAITASGTAVLRVAQFNGLPGWWSGGAGTLTTVLSAVAENNHTLKAASGSLISVYATNLTTTAGMLLVFNATTAPADGAVTPQDCAPLSASGLASVNYGPGSIASPYTVGITAVVSSATTCFTKTTGVITAFIHGTVQ